MVKFKVIVKFYRLSEFLLNLYITFSLKCILYNILKNIKNVLWSSILVFKTFFLILCLSHITLKFQLFTWLLKLICFRVTKFHFLSPLKFTVSTISQPAVNEFEVTMSLESIANKFIGTHVMCFSAELNGR